MNDIPHPFWDDNIWAEKVLDSKEAKELRERRLNAKILKREKYKDMRSQRKGYDTFLDLDDGRHLTFEEKVRRDFYPDLLLEIKSISLDDGSIRLGWLTKSEAEVLAYFQPKNGKPAGYLTLWKLKDLAHWSKTNEFIDLVNKGIIKEVWSRSLKDGRKWKTMSYAVPFHVLNKKDFSFINDDYEKNRDIIPLDFWNGNASEVF